MIKKTQKDIRVPKSKKYCKKTTMLYISYYAKLSSVLFVVVIATYVRLC